MKTPATVVAGVDFGDATFAASVRDGVARIEDLMATELGKADELMAEAVQHLFQAGGKRFRPLFTVLSAQLGPEPDAWQVTVAGAVIELVHLATLYHDDVMDEAQVRRGADSANARWGNNIAILAGDYLFATASRLVSQLGPDAVRVIADTFAQLVTGQMRETRGAADGVDSVEHYLKVVYEKTACLIAASGTFGATFSGADDGADPAARPARRHRRHGVPDLRRHHRHRQRSRRVGQGARHRPARGRPHAAGAVRAARDRSRRRPAARAAGGPVEDDADVAEALALLRASTRDRAGEGDGRRVRRAGPRRAGAAARPARAGWRWPT